VKPSRILSVDPIINSELSSVHIELLCSLCDGTDAVALNLDQLGDLSWLRRCDFYFFCWRHRHLAQN